MGKVEVPSVEKKVKKTTSKRKPKKSGPVDIKKLSMTDLYYMHLFVSGDANRSFGKMSPEARKIVLGKQKEIEEEIYERLYGLNPFVVYKQENIIKGGDPLDVPIDRFVVAKGPNKEPEDKAPETFVVKKNR